MEYADVTRRNFLKTSLVAGLAGAATAVFSGCSSSSTGAITSAQTTLEEINWDGEFDVVIVGFGAAGACAALAAAQSGATVLLCDKAPEGQEGGNSRYSTQMFVSCDAENKESAQLYYQQLRGDFNTPDDVISAYVDGLSTIKDTLSEWGMDKSRMLDVTEIDIAAAVSAAS